MQVADYTMVLQLVTDAIMNSNLGGEALMAAEVSRVGYLGSNMTLHYQEL